MSDEIWWYVCIYIWLYRCVSRPYIFLPNTYSVNSLGLSIEALLYALNSLSSVSPIDPCIFGSSAYPQLRAGIKRCIFGILFVSNANNGQTIVAYSWRNVILFSHLLFLTLLPQTWLCWEIQASLTCNCDAREITHGVIWRYDDFCTSLDCYSHTSKIEILLTKFSMCYICLLYLWKI